MVTSNSTHVDQGLIGEFAIGDFALGTPAPISIWTALSEPVRKKIDPRRAVALIASGVFQIVTTSFPERVDEAKWHQPYSTPVRFKAGLRPYLQRSFTADTSPFPASRNMAWHGPFGEPVRFKPGLKANQQQAFTIDSDLVPGSDEGLSGWLLEFGKPVWPPKGLSRYLQQSLAYHPRILPTPTVTVTWNSTETSRDVALIAVNVYNAATSAASGQGAKVSITELSPSGLPVAAGNDPVSIRET